MCYGYNKQLNHRGQAELAAISQAGGNSVTFTELNNLDTHKC